MAVEVVKTKYKPLYESRCETCGQSLADTSSGGEVYFRAYAHAKKGHRVFVRCITELQFEGIRR